MAAEQWHCKGWSFGADKELHEGLDGGLDGGAVCWRERKLLRKVPVGYTQLCKLQHSLFCHSSDSHAGIATMIIIITFVTLHHQC